jgi:hypothetical protein
MKRSDMMPIIHNQESMWQLSADRRRVRMQLPGLPIAGASEPLLVNIDFDAAVVDQIIERLQELRTQMVPAPSQVATRH